MPKITVDIEYDWPDDPYWLNPDSVWYCLQAKCNNTKFNVTWNKETGPDPSWLYNERNPFQHEDCNDEFTEPPIAT